MDEQLRQILLAVFAADELLPPDLLAILDALTSPPTVAADD
jgi:hypothetical protein